MVLEAGKSTIKGLASGEGLLVTSFMVKGHREDKREQKGANLAF
jgi:hypothetical protein